VRMCNHQIMMHIVMSYLKSYGILMKINLAMSDSPLNEDNFSSVNCLPKVLRTHEDGSTYTEVK
jgi:hypothetical protein